MRTTVPPKVLELGERNRLGEFVRYHRGWTFISILIQLSLPMSILTLFWALVVTASLILSDENHLHRNPLLIFLIYFGICYPLFCGIQACTAYLQWGRQRVYEFSDGMIITKGQRILGQLHWNDISTITYTSIRNANPAFLISALNKSYALYSRTLLPRIEQELIKRELPGKLACYEAGETLNFDSISVNKEGISKHSAKHKKRNLPPETITWNQLYPPMTEKHFTISFTKRTDSKPYRFTLYNIKNTCVLRALLSTVTSSIFVLMPEQLS